MTPLTYSMIAKVSWRWLLSCDTPSKVKWLRPFWELQKMDLSGHHVWIWVARWNFLLVSSTTYVCLQASLGSYLSVETNRSVIRHFWQILWSQTWADGDYSASIPLKGKGGWDHFESFKKWISMNVTLDFEWCEKIFFRSPVPRMRACKYP